METFTEKTELVFNQDLSKLYNSHIAVVGLGGVGGYVVEMLVRLGVSKLTLIDCDKFEITNLNRQILATQNTIDKEKSFVAKERVLSINPDCNVTVKQEKISAENIDSVLTDNYDYVIDAIDDVLGKIAIIKYCSEKNIKFVCCMGTGNRYKNPQFVVEDLFKTSYDGLAKKMRNELKKQGFNKSVKVVYTKEQAEKSSALGSVVYYPLMCAGTLVSFVVNDIIK